MEERRKEGTNEERSVEEEMKQKGCGKNKEELKIWVIGWSFWLREDDELVEKEMQCKAPVSLVVHTSLMWEEKSRGKDESS